MTSTTIIDSNWMGQPRAIATILLESNGHHILIDPGPGSTLSHLREQLAARGISIAQLDTILLTHIHLDHAGATGALVRENPRLRVYVHRNGAPHLIDPSKLLHSAGRLWGDALPRLFGETLPVPAENLQILDGGEALKLGARKIDVAYTPGHASHHVSYFDGADGVAFIGDTGGIRIENGPYILPATPPPDIDLELWEGSFAEILQRKPVRLFLTHYGFSEDPETHIADFRDRLHRWAGMAAETIRNSADETAARDAFVARAHAEMSNEIGEAGAEHHAFTAGLDLSFLGLARYLKKRQKLAAEKTQ